MSAKKTLEEQIGTLTLASNAWVEPMREWLKTAVSLCETAKNAEPTEIKQAFLQMDGLNLFFDRQKSAAPAACKISFPPRKHLARTARRQRKRALDALSFQKKFRIGGETGIRTLGTVARTHAFQACTFNHSVTSPSCHLSVALSTPSNEPLRLALSLKISL